MVCKVDKSVNGIADICVTDAPDLKPKLAADALMQISNSASYCLFWKKNVSLAEAAVIYDINASSIRRWREQYLSGKEMPSQPAACTKKVKPMGRPRKKQPQTELEVLQAENERLRAEVALLKKVKALVEERERQERKTGR